VGRGLPRAFLLTVAVLLEAETISPGFAVPEDSTTSLVAPADGGLKGAGPDEDAAFSHGLGGAATKNYKIVGIGNPMKKEQRQIPLSSPPGNTNQNLSSLILTQTKLHFDNAQNCQINRCKIMKSNSLTKKSGESKDQGNGCGYPFSLFGFTKEN